MQDNSLQRKEILQKVSNGMLTAQEAAVLIKKLYKDNISKPIGKELEQHKKDSKAFSNILDEVNEREVFSSNTNASTNKNNDIAIIGVSGRFPDAPNVNKLWENLEQGKCSIGDMPVDRWKWDDITKSNPKSKNIELNSKWGAFLSNIDQFDPFFFNLSVREAEMMDPRQRLFLQEAWKCLEDAGYSDKDLSDKECGVFVGCQEGDYVKGFKGEINPYISIGNSNSILAARISYFLNLKGPTMAIDTACSSTLVAVHLGCQSIRAGSCEIAIAGGVLITSTPAMFMGLNKLGMFSPKGQCRVFDNDADGTVMGEAVGAVLLKSLESALRDGDNIYGVIKGSEINQDGKTSGITAPSGSAQTALECKVYEKYNINPETIGYIEAHGTGTKLGDPIEVQALTDTFRRFTDKKNFCAVGSVKSNIGHSMPAAGLSSLIKVLGCFKRKRLVPSLNYKKANEHIDFENSPFYVNTELKEWKTNENIPRRAAISSFGFSGTNCHIVLEEAPSQEIMKVNKRNPYELVAISAKTEDALKIKIKDFYEWLELKGGNHSIQDISYTLAVGRSHFPVRLGIVASSINELKNIVNKIYIEGVTNQGFISRGNEKKVKTNADIRKNIDTLLNEIKSFRSLSDHGYKDKLLSLAELYVKGYNVNFKELFKDTGYKRISLPTYPFSKKRYWIPDNNNIFENTNEKNEIVKKIHPLIEKNVSTFDGQRFTNCLKGDEFYLTDHVINDFKILPGVAYIEMAFAAGNIAAKRNIRKIKNVVWTRPIIVEKQPKKLHIDLYPSDEKVDYEIFSLGEGNERLIHSQGNLVYESNSKSKNREYKEIIDIGTIKRRCKYSLNKVQCYKLFEESGFRYGSKFKAIQELYICDDEALSFIQLPSQLKNEFEKYLLHPTLLDGALQTVMGVRISEKNNDEGPNIPFMLGEIEILKPLTTECYVYLRQSKSQSPSNSRLKKYDIDIVDLYGNPLVAIKDFSLKAFKQQGEVEDSTSQSTEHKKDSKTLYCQNIWKELKLSNYLQETKIEKIGDILLFDDDEALQEELIEKFKASAGSINRVVLVKPGKKYKIQKDLIYEVNPSCKDDYIKLIETLTQQGIEPKRIIYNWSKESFKDEEKSIIKQLKRSVYSVINLSQVLLELNLQGKTKLLYLQQCIDRAASCNPIYSAVSAIVKTIRQENSKFIYKTINISSMDYGVSKSKEIVDILLQEFMEENEFEITYIDKKRYVRRLKEIDNHCTDMNEVELKENGVYLIIGGLGGLGLIFARYLANKVKPRIILVGRSKLDFVKRVKINELKATEAEITYIQADISRQEEAKRLLEKVKERYGVLDGVINCAGINQDSYILNKTNEEIDRVMESKVFGTVYLEKAVKNENLDFFIMFSSTAAVLGNSGQSDYSFANCFMDYFAIRQTQLAANNGRIISINWPLWSHGGMQVNKEFKRMAEKIAGIKTLDTASGIKAFEKVLALGHNQMIIIEGKPYKLRQKLGLIEDSTKSQENMKNDNVSWDGIDSSIINALQEDLVHIVSKFTKVSNKNIDPYEDIQDYGLDSVALTAFSNDINEKYDLGITPAIFFELDEPTINSLAQYLFKEYRSILINFYRSSLNTEKLDNDLSMIKEEKKLYEVSSEEKTINNNINENNVLNEPIAIIGMDIVMPGSSNAEEYWRNLEQEKDLITQVPKDRWDCKALCGDMKNFKWGGFMKEVDKFDAEFFNMSPREAKMTDPQQRMFLETVWKTFEDAGYNPTDFAGRKIGVFLGISSSDYYEIMMKNSIELDAHSSIGNSSSIRANRVSYIFDFRGPSEPIDTACSSSLISVHRGVEAIRSGTCEMAIAGGVNVIASPTLFRVFNSAGMLSEDGRCKTFDKSADGYVRGEGVGAVLLKPLKKAVEDGNHIYAVIKGTCENHGGRAKSLTAPNANSQAQLITDAYERAEIKPDAISYIEAHGTGTSLGDPVEINGLKKAFKELYKKTGIDMPIKPHCGLGSVKTNIGHLEAAAGIAGIAKILLALKYKKIPATIHFKEINPYIDIDKSPFYIVNRTKEWKPIMDRAGKYLPRVAGISSFGYGGSNAHIVLEEYINSDRAVALTNESSKVIVMSAKNEDRLKNYAEDMIRYLEQYRGFNQDSKNKLKDELLEIVSEILNVNKEEIDKDIDIKEYGLDRVGMVNFVQKINNILHKELTEKLFSQYPSINDLADYLAKYNENSTSDLEEQSDLISMEEIAYTLQVGRSAMEERIGIVASNINELIKKLKRFISGEKDIEELYRDRVELKSRRIENSEKRNYTHENIMRADAKKIAQMFVSGVNINWELLYQNRKPNRISLPTYPFARERHWFDLSTSRIKNKKKDDDISIIGENVLKAPKTKLVLKNTSNKRDTPITKETSSESKAKKDIKSPTNIMPNLKNILAKVLYMDVAKLDHKKTFKELGLDSILCVEFAKEIREQFKVEIKATKLYDYSTLNKLSEYLISFIEDDESKTVAQMKSRDTQSEKQINVSDKKIIDKRSSLIFSLKKMLANVLYMTPSKVNSKKTFKELGLDSILCVEFAKKIREKFEVSIKATKLYDYSTIDELAKYLDSLDVDVKNNDIEPTYSYDNSNKIEEKEVYNEEALFKTDNRESKKIVNPNDVAVIGIAARLPGGENVNEFWGNLKNGVDSITEVPPERWDVSKYYSPNINEPGKCYSKWGGFLKDVDKFDPLFFNISPAEAEFLDPQQRIFMQEAWKALEDAGYPSQRLDNMKCGVYVGVMTGSEYQQNMFNAHSILSARIPYFLNLKGPALPIDTACSSSMVAIHMACKSLINREVDMMLAGGVTLYLTVKPYKGMCKSGMLSKEGKCKTFDNDADGFVPAEGVGVIVLKLLDKAIEDGDYIYGVIKGSGINQDGRTNGITAPSAQSQTDLELEVYKNTGINPETISYIECHGTGTKLGDPIEIDGLTEAFRKYTDKKRFCPIGSVKTNIGHTSAASGVVGLIKVLLSLKNKRIPPSLNFIKENEHINFADSPFYVNTKLKEWKKPNFGPRRAAVSSFGFSGTNVHMIVEEFPMEDQKSPKVSKPRYLIPISAKNQKILNNKYKDLLQWIGTQEDKAIQNIAFTLARGRTHFIYRSAMIVEDIYDLKNKLNMLCNGDVPKDFSTGRVINEDDESKNDFDEEIKELINKIKEMDIHKHEMYKEKLLDLAELYVKGYDIDWESLYKESDYYRIPLPTYPFLKQRCWISPIGGEEVAEENRPSLNVPSNPLAGVDKSMQNEKRFEIELNGEEFFLCDNVVYDQKVLPGVAYLEIARAAGEMISDKKVRKIENLIWSRLITVSKNPCRVSITFDYENQDSLNFVVKSIGEDDNYIVNAQGKIIYNSNKENQLIEKPIDINKVKRRCTNVLKGQDCYEAYKGRKFEIGPSLQCMKMLYYNETEAVTELELPKIVKGTFSDFVLHPSLMDGVLQTVTGLMINTTAELGRPYLSFALGETEIIGTLSEKCYVYARLSDNYTKDSVMKKFDMIVMNEEGGPIIKMKEFTLKKSLQASHPSVMISNKLEEDKGQCTLEYDDKDTLCESFRNYVGKIISRILKINKEHIDFKTSLLEYGFTSITIIEFINQINEAFEIEASVEAFFDIKNPTIESLTEYLFENFKDRIIKHYTHNQESYNLLKMEVSAAEDAKQSRRLTNIQDIISWVQEDIYKIASDTLKVTKDGYDDSSIELFSNAINEKFKLENSKTVFLTSSSLGDFIKYIGRDFKEHFINYYNNNKIT